MILSTGEIVKDDKIQKVEMVVACFTSWRHTTVGGKV
jgi:hypothetical protein